MIGNRIRKAREKRGITQEQCALEVGMDPSVYNRIENNKREPTATELLCLLRVLGVTPAYLLGIEEAPAANGSAPEAMNGSAAHAGPSAEAVTLLSQALLLMVKEKARRSVRKAKVVVKRFTGGKKTQGGG